MSWRSDSDATGLALARLLSHGGQVQPVDLDAALIARRAVLDLASTMHLDLTGLGSRTAAPTVAGLSTDPVRTFGQLLHRQPRPHPDRSLTEVTAAPGMDPAGQAWQLVATAATLVHHDWLTADPRSRPSGDPAWTAMDRTAALVHAVTVLDQDLIGSAQRAHRPEVVRDLQAASTSGLGLAAVVVRDLAKSGPLPEVPDLLHPPPRRVHPVRDVADLPAALAATREHLLRSPHLTPAHAQLCASGLARLSLRLADTLSMTAPHGRHQEPELLMQRLHTLALLLTAVASTPRRTETIAPSDPLPLAQVGEMVRWTSAPRPSAGATPGRTTALISEAVVGVARLTQALDVTARRQYDEGHWLVPSERPGPLSTRLAWMPPEIGAPPPPLVRSLVAAAQGAVMLQRATAAVSPGATRQALGHSQQGLASVEALEAALARRVTGRPERLAAALHGRPTRVNDEPRDVGAGR